MVLVHAAGLIKTYRAGDVDVPAIKGADFTIESKSFVSFVGPSGSGKSTLLNLIGCLDHPSSGKLTVIDTDVGKLDRRAAANFRGQHIGFIFQDFNLIPVLTAYENVEYPLIMVQNWPAQKRHQQVMHLLDAVGMADQANKRPDQMSGGQKQRVAVARALVANSKLVLADEPTANLDTANGEQAMQIMQKLNRETGTAFIFATHDPRVVAYARRVVQMRDGRIVEDSANANGAGG